MSKETPTAVLRKAVRCFKKALTADDIAVILGSIVERHDAALDLLWKHFRAVSLFVGVREESYISGQKYAKGALVRRGEDIFIAKASTSAPLENAAYWLHFTDLGEPPRAALPERRKKKVRVTAHDSRGRIAEFEEIWEPENG